jgi:hypothetical protein
MRLNSSRGMSFLFGFAIIVNLITMGVIVFDQFGVFTTPKPNNTTDLFLPPSVEI